MRRITSDFGAEQSYRKASDRIREHYGIEIGPTAVRKITMAVALECSKRLEEAYEEDFRAMDKEGKDVVIAQADGSMVCTVAPGKRRGKRPREWREIRLCSAIGQGDVQARYAATMGSVAMLGRRWGHCALAAGRGLSSYLHVVGDGADWIRYQCREVFGEEANFLCDFYHVSEYLGEAASACRPGKPDQWLKTQQNRLKRGALQTVLKELGSHREAEDCEEEQAPVRRCNRYLTNRLDCLDYAKALGKKLPIGSGQIESGHKHVIQARLKQAGMAWLPENADLMAQLRVTRVNEQWEALWN